MERSENLNELSAALLKFHGEVGTIKKTSENPFFKSKYASLKDILDVVAEPLRMAGLSVLQFPAGDYSLTTILLHSSGQYISESFAVKPVKDDPQGRGSGITYQRRYALGAVLALNIEEDDDGNMASRSDEPTMAGKVNMTAGKCPECGAPQGKIHGSKCSIKE